MLMIYCYYGRKAPPASSRLPIQHVISEEFTKGQQISGSSWLKCLSCSRTQQLLHQINKKYCFQCETCTVKSSHVAFFDSHHFKCCNQTTWVGEEGEGGSVRHATKREPSVEELQSTQHRQTEHCPVLWKTTHVVCSLKCKRGWKFGPY